MSDCNNDCASCTANCDSRKMTKEDFLEELSAGSSVKKVIGIVSGKGGVGKSLVTSMMAVCMNRLGRRTAILDADITGPSIPMTFGIKDAKVAVTTIGESDLIMPVSTDRGIEIMSSNLLLNKETDPVVWRGPLIAGIVKQFWKETLWEDIEYMFVDMPPGTGDVPLTVFQTMPVDGIIIVTSPQDLVSMIVAKAVNMAKSMDIPILGIVENMSYLECPDCGKKISVFGESHLEEVAAENEIDILAQIPINPEIAKAVDAGKIEELDLPWLTKAITKIL